MLPERGRCVALHFIIVSFRLASHRIAVMPVSLKPFERARLQMRTNPMQAGGRESFSKNLSGNNSEVKTFVPRVDGRPERVFAGVGAVFLASKC